MLDDRYLPRAAIPERIAVDVADEPLVPANLVQVLADSRPVDHESAAIKSRCGGDGIEQQGGGVVGVGPESPVGGRSRLVVEPVGRLLGVHAGGLVGVAAEFQIWAGDKHAA